MINLIKNIILKYKQNPRLLIDELKTQFKSITKFFDYVKEPLINKIIKFRDIDVALSHRYNKFIENVENDINLIYGIQEETRNNMLSSWNVVENSYPEEVKPESPYDDNFILEHDSASIISDRITLGVKSFDSALPYIKEKPLIDAKCSDKKIDIFYGKAWGSYVKGNESGEDGIRAENNDGSVIVDELDTFWEAEAVVLQESRTNTKYLQAVKEKDISLTVTTKIIFEEPIEANTLTIRPYNAAVSAYYKLIRVDISDGVTIVPLNIEETPVMRETTIVFDVPEKLENKKVRSITITLKQDTGYFMKYTLGYFRIKNNESWVDVTGPHVVREAARMGGDFDANISYLIENAYRWILNYWLPGVVFTQVPTLVKDHGEDGFLLVPSSESKRKRYTIGITDVIIGKNEYYDTAEKVTKEIDIPDGMSTISIDARDQGDIYYYVSFDNGMNWNRIIPLGKQDERGEDLRIVPKKLYINSDLAYYRREDTETGHAAFIGTSSKKIRVKFVLKRNPEIDIVPSIFDWELKWGKE